MPASLMLILLFDMAFCVIKTTLKSQNKNNAPMNVLPVSASPSNANELLALKKIETYITNTTHLIDEAERQRLTKQFTGQSVR
jgi:hypothetical protein